MTIPSNMSPLAGSRKQEAGSRKQEAGSRKQEAGSRKPSRDVIVDIMKGIGILWVIEGHAGYSPLIPFTPYAIHMQLFFIIAGCFIDLDSPTIVFLIKKIKSLLIPFYLYLIAFMLLAIILKYLNCPSYGPNTLLECFSINNWLIRPFADNHHYGLYCPAWFVPVLFGDMLLLAFTRPLLKILCRSELFSWLSFSCILVLGWGIIRFWAIPAKTDWGLGILSRLLVSYCLVCCGFFLWRMRGLWTQIPWLVICGLIFLFLVKVFNPAFSMLNNIYIYGGSYARHLFMIFSVLGFIFVYGCSKILQQVPWIAYCLAYCGRKSFHIMALHLSGFYLLNMIVCYIYKTDLSGLGIYDKARHVSGWMQYLFSIIFCISMCISYDFFCKIYKSIMIKKNRIEYA